jgi:hypothetical protein
MFPGLPTKVQVPKFLIEEVDFGSDDSTISKTIYATWVKSSTPPVAFIHGTTVNHDLEDVVLEELKVVVGNIIDGVQFDIVVHAPNSSWGKYNVLIFSMVA